MLAGDGVALVRHGARTLLLLREELLGFTDFGALEMADLGSDLVERGGEDGERGDVGGVAVALDDLGGNIDRLEAERGADGLFVLRFEVAEGADGAGELADAEVLGGGVEALEVALNFRVPEQELEAEGGGFGVDAVGAADGGGVFELEGALLQDFGEALDALAEDGVGFKELEGLRGVDDVGGGEAVVQPARGWLRNCKGSIDVLGDGGGEGDDVVADFGFDLVDAGDGERAFLGDGVGGGLRNEAGGGEGLRGGDLDAQPAAVLVLVGPDAAELGAGVARNHKDQFKAKGALMPGGHHFVGCWASRGAPAGREEEFRADQREERAKL